MSARIAQRLRAALLVVALAAGAILLGAGSWIHLKAFVAQQLLARAWDHTLNGGVEARPWPWADTWALGRLHVPRLDIEQIVLEGASGRTLAFAPGHLEGSALPGEAGTSVLSGHRDTHFDFLKRLEIGDEIEMETAQGRFGYRVSDLRVVDTRSTPLLLQRYRAELVLLTCYPFDVIATTGPLRYRVTAIPMELGATPPGAGGG